MSSGRTYLQGHGIHETLQDCVHDLVLQRPPTTLEVLEVLQKRIETNTNRNHCEYFVVLAGNSRAKKEVAEHLSVIATGRGAIIADIGELNDAVAAKAAAAPYSYNAHKLAPLLQPGSVAFAGNVRTIAEAVHLQQMHGPCKACVVVADKSKDLTDKAYLSTVNQVAQYYSVKAAGGTTIVGSVAEINGALA